jgi:hypothetical protein
MTPVFATFDAVQLHFADIELLGDLFHGFAARLRQYALDALYLGDIEFQPFYPVTLAEFVS